MNEDSITKIFCNGTSSKTLRTDQGQMEFDLKAFSRLAHNAYKAYFPRLPNYENILKVTNRSSLFTVVLLWYLLMLNRQMNTEG